MTLSDHTSTTLDWHTMPAERVTAELAVDPG